MNAEEIVQRAVQQKTPAERNAFLDGVCADQPELRARVEALLQAQETAGGLLEHRVFDRNLTVDVPSPLERPGTVIGPYKLL
jgi:hypothetical protein